MLCHVRVRANNCTCAHTYIYSLHNNVKMHIPGQYRKSYEKSGINKLLRRRVKKYTQRVSCRHICNQGKMHLARRLSLQEQSVNACFLPLVFARVCMQAYVHLLHIFAYLLLALVHWHENAKTCVLITFFQLMQRRIGNARMFISEVHYYSHIF